MSIKNLGIIGGGQLGSLLAVAAKKLNINTTIYCDDIDAPAQNFCNKFIYGKYDNKIKMDEFIKNIDVIYSYLTTIVLVAIIISSSFLF